MAKSTIKSYVEAGAQFTEMSRQQVDALVKLLVKTGEVRRRDAEQMVQGMLSRGRETTERIGELVQAEVAKQLKVLSQRFEDVESRLESMAASIRVGVVSSGGVITEPPVESPADKQSGAKKPAPKKSGAKKSGAKKSGAKKSSAKKSGAKKSSAKKSGAKKSATASTSDAVGSSGVRKVSTTRPADTTE